VRAYLRAAGAWPLEGYVPLVAPLPAGVDRLHPSAAVATAGRFSETPRDDDLDYTVLGLHLLEAYGPELSVADVAREWLDRIPFTQTYTAERAAYRNLVRGVPPETAADVDNPYREWIGALIRADAFGYVSPGDPRAAVRRVAVDASLSHRGNGLAAALWGAALVAAAFTARDARAALGIARTWIPPGTRLRSAQDLVLALHDDGAGWDELEAALDREVGHYSWVHAINNAAGIAAALLWGGGDLARSVGLAVGLGWDSDSSAATVGSVVGALRGTHAIPPELAAPLGDTLRSAIRDFDRSRISALADRTLALVS
jgi:ADP-ribosylglycohydrolase